MTTDAHKPRLLALFVRLQRLRLARLLLWMARMCDGRPRAMQVFTRVGSRVIAPVERKMFGRDFDKARD